MLDIVPDRQLADALFYIDVRIGELLEIDGIYDPDGDITPAAAGLHADREEIHTEMARRIAAGITIEDPDAPTLEERLEPFGIEWQIEQRERSQG